ncbi:MAG: glycosyltransferase family 9 protein, partial [Candidatus Marinimicrobia bacterium]|nr:glycosyltransferase family 9 protein [Candidatus Neomarinimicrobiota bacterium]
NGTKGNKYLVCIPGAGWRNKTWKTEKYLELFKYFMENNFEIILLGSKKDVICNDCESENNSLINMAGKTEFRQSLAIISQAQLVIGSDTGFVHAAEALGIPTVMLLGPTSTETGAGVTKTMSKNIQLSHIWCRPCSQNGSRPCYRNERYCMNGIQPDSIINQIEEMI